VKLRYRIAGGLLAVLIGAVAVLALVLSHDTACPAAPAAATGDDLVDAAIYRCYGSPDVLSVQRIAKPVPAADEVLVRVEAAAVNPLDWHYLQGSPYFMRLGSGLGAPTQHRLGVDFAGTVESVGSAVTRFKPGDQVFGGKTGAFGEYVTVKESGALATKPAAVTPAQAAAVPIAGVTALQALRDSGEVKPGMKVLVNGASGGVGSFAVQIAKALGAEVTGVCSTRNLELVRSLGADRVLDYTREDYTRGDTRYDLIIDNVGNHSPGENAEVLTEGGKLVMVGGPSGNWIGPLKNPLQALLLSPFTNREFVLFLAELNAADLEALAGLMQSGQLTPVIDRHYPLADIAEAIRYSEQGRARGKIIIDTQ
jgi:NADPH:quinone reductase-like Zn-dependent oxidoreductase